MQGIIMIGFMILPAREIEDVKRIRELPKMLILKLHVILMTMNGI